ncbi:PEGA domain-containing protein [Methanoculleus receptaculi]|uniref:PEGA domain-containing protein n=1 Tax=Methanoculleus receptaculi TaxID=394967 RepID=A0AAX4FVT4_9EURY|nr:PEGA domain-containing protein [Methanoculleus receptaculi]WOX57256.1 PEGA domain-containing protein [Methanoculleus receptaculi]
MTLQPVETTGVIDVVSYPAGADVFLDEKYQGRTPSAGVYTISNVQVGGHTVRVALSGYQDYTTSVNRQCCNHKSRHRDAPARSTLHSGLDLGHLLARGRPGLHR